MILALALLAAQPAAAPVAEEKKICRLTEADTGSIMAKRECKTKAEWTAISKANQQNAERYRQDRAPGNGMPQQGQ